MYGGGGNDLIFGANHGEILRGGNGNDELWGFEGRDFVRGGKGADIIAAGRGIDDVRGGPNNDAILIVAADLTSGSAGFDQCFHFEGDDIGTIDSCEEIVPLRR